MIQQVSLHNPISQLCSQAQFEEPEFSFWMDKLNVFSYWRKKWELAYIAQALNNGGMLANGRSALGFGVGTEPLPALFASYGVEVLATDGYIGGAWAETAQFSGGISDLPFMGVCDEDAFKRLVTHRAVDMNAIPDDLRQGAFDFVWSTNSLDHLGTIDKGLAFIENVMDCLKPGGMAIHTTEYNLDSNSDTLAAGGVVLFRECDILRIVGRLQEQGHEIDLNLARGNGRYDKMIDQPPYIFDDKTRVHICLNIGGYAITSIGLIIRKAAE